MSDLTNSNNSKSTTNGRELSSKSINEASGFGHWSRNLSNQRFRELDRLNQIEKRRQFLELNQQNDLFTQNTSSELDPQSKASEVRDIECGRSNSATKTPPCDSISRGGSARTGPYQDEFRGDCSALPVSDQQIDLRQQSKRCLIHGQSSSGNELFCSDPKDDVIERRPPEEESELEKSSIETGDKSIDERLRGSCNGRLEQVPRPFADYQKVGKKMITTDQLKRFVSLAVPENKRVYCLIVRDRISLLDKAKSYFYPTYYLFVQAIVDTQEIMNDCIFAKSSIHQNSENPPDSRNASASADNSFSASSSISADMLFIGAVDGEANATSINPTKTSYSDNETNLESEIEEEGNRSESYEHSKVKSRVKSVGALQGRNSPLVFPDGAGNRNDTSDWGSHMNRLSFGHDKTGSEVDPVSSKNRSQINQLKDEESEEEEEDDDDDDELGSSGANQANEIKTKIVNSEINDRNDGNDNNDDDLRRALFDESRNPYTGTYGVLLAGRRRKKTKTYHIGPTEYGHTKKNSICKLKSNVLGTQFHAVRINNESGNDDRCTIVSISYETNVLGFKGPRKMRIFLAKDPAKGYKKLPETSKKDPTAVVQLNNLTPSWSAESQSYVLNFHGRVTQASVKNFQLVRSDDQLTNVGNSNETTSSLKHNWPHDGGGQTASSTKTKAGLVAKSPSVNTPVGYQSSSLTSNYARLAGKNSTTATPETGASQLTFGFGNGQTSSVPEELRNCAAATQTFVSKDNTEDYNLVTAGRGTSYGYNDSIVMQFGRISNNEFTCDVSHPLSILQAFAIALSSFDSKLACE